MASTTHSPSPHVEIHEVRTKAEFARLNDVLWTANFHPYEPIFTLCHAITGPTAADRAADIARDTDLHWAAHERNPASHYIYVVDPTTGRVVGGCEWTFHHTNPFPEGPVRVPCTWYPEGSEVAEFASHVLTQCLLPRRAWFQRAHAGVNRMGVHPDYRRQGVGRMLMQWGHARIDAWGYECLSIPGRWGGGCTRSAGIGGRWRWRWIVTGKIPVPSGRGSCLTIGTWECCCFGGRLGESGMSVYRLGRGP
ncbi:hypothetical protein BO99DRAFT_129043 [Aspergillus violaceofuscus CBS 115571]|uniref:N-acetyltransferase domain-containing protein n=1 Tax=Aspergillus violaceofuscus (strain CBS 115571) TaxID=1450538 RepID=A0A2V5HNM3_ASPV1|nr:hypothetical protein BO99DRAFT_129043 [Aspergillus violaceofuscus CBS 115571]